MNNKYEGKVCPYCKTKLTSSDDIVVCSECEMPHHLSCWQDNQGCTTFGCNGVMKSVLKSSANDKISFNMQKEDNDNTKITIRESKNIDIFYESKEYIYSTNLPVIIESIILIRDRIKNKVFARCIFRNISPDSIKAMLIEIIYRDIWGNVLGDPIEFQYLDLKTKRETKFGQTQAIEIINNNVRKIDVKIKKILFDNESILIGNDEIIKHKRPQSLDQYFENLDCIETYKRETTVDACFVPSENDYFWQCTCGAINYINEENCNVCKCNREHIKKVLDIHYINDKTSKRKEEELAKIREEKRIAEEKNLEEQKRKLQEQQKNEEIYKKADELCFDLFLNKPKENFIEAIELFKTIIEYKDSKEKIIYCNKHIKQIEENERREIKKQQSKEKIKKFKKTLLIGSAITVFIIGVSIGIIFYGIPEIKYQNGQEALKNELFDEAYEIFAELDGYSNSETMMKEAIFQKAVKLYNDGKYKDAIEEFEKITEYRNSNDFILESKYRIGISLMKSQQYEEAKKYFSKIITYKDSESMMNEINYQIGLSYYSKENYTLAKSYFEELGNYKDCKNKIVECQYAIACEKIESKQYSDAYDILLTIKDYYLTEELVEKCITNWVTQALRTVDINLATTFSKKVRLTNRADLSLIYQLINKEISPYTSQYMYWDSSKTKRAKVVSLLYQSIGDYSDAYKLSLLFSDIYEKKYNLSSVLSYGKKFKFLYEYSLENENIKTFLLDYWETSDKSYYFEFYKNSNSGISSRYNLPHSTNNADYYSIDDGIYYWHYYSFSGTKSSVFKFSIVDYYTIKVYCYYNGRIYTLYRR